MADQEQIFKDKTIKVTGETSGLNISIDGRSVEIHYQTETDEYHTDQLPYRGYKDPIVLAQDLVTGSPDFV